MREEITPNMILSFYIVTPIVIGTILSDFIGIDISNVAREHIGLLRFLQDSGKDIQTKSMIFLMDLLLIPVAYIYMSEYRRRKPYAQKTLDETNTSKLLLLIFGALSILLAGLYMFMIGPNQSAPTSSSPGVRVILGSSHWDISFGIFSGFMLAGLVGMLLGAFIGTKEIIHRFKK